MIEKLFQPRSVVIVGASADASKISGIPLANLKRLGYPGRIYAVNPSTAEIDGVPSYPDIASLPETPDVAFVVVPGERALKVAEDCAKRGVSAAIIASTGFAEAGPEGAERQTALAALVSEYGIRFVGPNTNGLYSAHDRLSLGYNSGHAEAFTPGAVSIVSHSGALFNTIAEALEAAKLGISKFVAVGNEADLNMLDYFEYLVGDNKTDIILMIVESISDGARFRSLAAKARQAGKRICVLKLGTSKAGAASTVAHSSRLAGSARAYAALFEAAGVGVVSSIESLVAFARLAHGQSDRWRPATRGLGLLTASGAGGTLLADAASTWGFDVAKVDEATAAALRSHLSGAEVHNPLDAANFGRTPNTPNTAPVLSADPHVEAMIAFGHKLPARAQRNAFASGFADGLDRTGKPHLMVAPSPLPEEQLSLLEQRGVPVFFNSTAAFEGLRALFDSALAGTLDLPPVHVTDEALAADHANAPSEELNEFDSMAVLHKAGLETVARARVSSIDEAVAFGHSQGWPVVLKGIVDGIAHKSDVGLVYLDLHSEADLARAYASLAATLDKLVTLQTHSDGAKASIVVQRMVRGGLETIVGVTTEAPLGQFLLIGQGGRQTEYLDDVRLWAIPASEATIRRGLAETTIGRIVNGSRWSRTETFEELVQTLLKLQDYAVCKGKRLRAVEINPLLIGSHTPVALDALVVQVGT